MPTMPKRKNDRRAPMSAAEFRRIRGVTRMTQAELADYMGLDLTTVANYERKRAPVPGPVALVMRMLERDHGR